MATNVFNPSYIKLTIRHKSGFIKQSFPPNTAENVLHNKLSEVGYATHAFDTSKYSMIPCAAKKLSCNVSRTSRTIKK